MHDLNPASRPRHLARLDAIRGLAIVLVFVFHIFGSSFPHRQDQLQWNGMLRDLHSSPSHAFLFLYPASFGWAGVSLFFVLSGFVIHYSFLTSDRPFSTGRFYWRRFRRIYPPYLIALVVFALLRFSWSWGYARDVVAHLFLLHNLSRSTFFGINAAFWSIAAEAQFYAVYPLLLWLRRRVEMSNIIRLAMVVSLTSCVVIVFHEPAIVPIPITERLSFPLVTWFDWVLGAFIAEKFCSNQRWVNRSGLALAGLMMAFVACTLWKPASVLSFTLVSVLCAVFIERCVWSVAAMNRLERGLVLPGLCSYSFYLWHAPPLLLVAGIAHKFNIGVLPYVLVIAPAIYLGTLLFSWVMYVQIEQRCTKFKLPPGLWKRMTSRNARLEVASVAFISPIDDAIISDVDPS